MRLTPPVTACLNCDRPITTTPGKRAKLYCDPSCKSNYRQKQQRLAKKAAAGLPLLADYVEAKDVAILHTNGVVEKIVPPKVKGKSKKKKVNKKGKSKAKVTVTDLTKPTGKKVVSDPPPKENYSIDSTKNNKGKGNKESAYMLKRRQSKQ